MKVEFHQGSLSVMAYEPISTDNFALKGCIQLTLSEFYILRALVSNMDAHISREQLILVGWPDCYVCANSLTMAIMALRRKLVKLGGFWEITTIQRVGYSLNLSFEFRYGNKIEILHNNCARV